MADFDLNAAATTFLNAVPYTSEMGLKLLTISADTVTTRLAMQPQLIGNALRGILHGGVISTIIDTTGGLIAFVDVYQRLFNLPEAELLKKIAGFATIDLRVDFLQPGQGQYFECTATLVRGGKKVSVTQMTLHNEKQELIAIGTASFFVGI